MTPKLSSNDLGFWETVYNSDGANKNFSRFVKSDTGIAYWERIGTTVSHPKNHILLRYDAVPKCFYIVKSGTVIGYEELANGNERIYYVMDKNAILLEANLLLGRPAGINFKTVEATKLICVEKQVLRKAIEADPQLMHSLFCSVANKFLEAMEELRGSRNHSAAWLLCELLLEFAERYGVQYDGKVLIQKRISLQIMASMLGLNRATAVRSMKKLRDMGLIENINGFYCVRSIEALRTHQKRIEN